MGNTWKSVIHVVEAMVPGILAAAADLKFTEDEIKQLSAKFAVEVLNETEAIKVFEAVLIIIKVAKS
jgi:hypothetical protein